MVVTDVSAWAERVHTEYLEFSLNADVLGHFHHWRWKLPSVLPVEAASRELAAVFTVSAVREPGSLGDGGVCLLRRDGEPMRREEERDGSQH